MEGGEIVVGPTGQLAAENGLNLKVKAVGMSGPEGRPEMLKAEV